ncbi:MAG: BON domain-containing protein [Spongiibacteraceae bacterium]|nr:BON domain-containing protein [Spongiibacteraceae bacterium]
MNDQPYDAYEDFDSQGGYRRRVAGRRGRELERDHEPGYPDGYPGDYPEHENADNPRHYFGRDYHPARQQWRTQGNRERWFDQEVWEGHQDRMRRSRRDELHAGAGPVRSPQSDRGFGYYRAAGQSGTQPDRQRRMRSAGHDGRAADYGHYDDDFDRDAADREYGLQGYGRGFVEDYGSGRGAEMYQREWEQQLGAPSHYRSHRGRGPKGYVRSDERIREEVCERLTHDHAVDASDVTVECKDGIVTLMGSVERRRDKHQVEDVVENVVGVTDIENRLKVRHRWFHRDEQTDSGSDNATRE